MTAKTRSQSVTDRLRELVLEGAFGPGEHLLEIPLAERMGVSRTPIRSALAALAQEGLLVYEAKRGYGVRTFGIADILAAYEARAVLEGLGCRLAAERGLDTAGRVRLEQCLATGDRLLKCGELTPENLAPYRQMNITFHETILAASGNTLLSDLVRQTHNIPLASNRIMVWEDYRIIFRSHDDHHRIFDAIINRQPQRADALMQEHVYYAGQVLKAHLEKKEHAQPKKEPERAGDTAVG